MKFLFATSALLMSAATSAPAARFELPANGWASWDIPTVADAPAWCCQALDHSRAQATVCNLDDRQNGFVSRDGETSDSARIYARFTDGKLDRLRALSVTCPVHANGAIRPISPSEQASAEWLATLVQHDRKMNRDLRVDAMAALAVHRTPLAYETLAGIARRGAQLEERKNALFWLALVRGRDGADLTTSLMFGDSDARMREHAAFALTQSSSPRIASDLTRLATTDRDLRVRGQAWFWLSHTESPQVEAAINAALRNEADQHVREQAIFALSQLPPERATRALIGVAENRALKQDDRRKAVFWLAQTESDGALAYLDKVLQSAPR